MNYDNLKKADPKLYDLIMKEFDRQKEGIELIASENFTSLAVMEASGSYLTNKYAEGYPEKRYYGGCEYVDQVEQLAIDRAKELFKAEHANVQPHSGSQANMAVYFSVLKPGDKILGMNLSDGGHLTHGSPVNFSGQLYDVVAYNVNSNGVIDYDEVMALAVKEQPKMIVAGASAYSRTIDFSKFREIADAVGAYLLVDMAHIAGLVATGLHPSPVPFADFVTTTTHKTLRGPRGGMILCKEAYKAKINKAIFPGMQGGPLEHIIAAKAVCFKEALEPDFKTYQKQVIKNAKALANALMTLGYDIVSQGTDNHLMLLDLSSTDISGKAAEKALDAIGIHSNKNTVPNEQRSPFVTSGIRLGTPAVTTRGMDEKAMEEIASIIDFVLKNIEGDYQAANQKVLALCKKYPLYN